MQHVQVLLGIKLVSENVTKAISGSLKFPGRACHQTHLEIVCLRTRKNSLTHYLALTLGHLAP